jgi:hypothetical protein
MAQRCAGHTSGYRIRVTNPSTGVSGESNSTFAILEPCEVSLLSPNGGEQLLEGEATTITWNASLSCGNEIQLELLASGVPCATIAEAAANTGSLTWLPAPRGSVTDRYQVVLTDPTSAAADTSDGFFRIDSPVYIEVSFGNAGYTVATNNPPWQDGLQMAFSSEAECTYGWPAWMDCPSGALVLDGSGSGAFFFPSQFGSSPSGGGLAVHNSCSSIDVALAGDGELVTPEVRLIATTDVGGPCRRELPITTGCHSATVNFTDYCSSSDGPLQIAIRFVDGSGAGSRYALRSVRYLFHGWALPEE